MKRILTLTVSMALLASSALADRLVIKGSDTLGAKLVPTSRRSIK